MCVRVSRAYAGTCSGVCAYGKSLCPTLLLLGPTHEHTRPPTPTDRVRQDPFGARVRLRAVRPAGGGGGGHREDERRGHRGVQGTGVCAVRGTAPLPVPRVDARAHRGTTHRRRVCFVPTHTHPDIPKTCTRHQQQYIPQLILLSIPPPPYPTDIKQVRLSWGRSSPQRGARGSDGSVGGGGGIGRWVMMT